MFTHVTKLNHCSIHFFSYFSIIKQVFHEIIIPLRLGLHVHKWSNKVLKPVGLVGLDGG